MPPDLPERDSDKMARLLVETLMDTRVCRHDWGGDSEVDGIIHIGSGIPFEAVSRPLKWPLGRDRIIREHNPLHFSDLRCGYDVMIWRDIHMKEFLGLRARSSVPTGGRLLALLKAWEDPVTHRFISPSTSDYFLSQNPALPAGTVHLYGGQTRGDHSGSGRSSETPVESVSTTLSDRRYADVAAKLAAHPVGSGHVLLSADEREDTALFTLRTVTAGELNEWAPLDVPAPITTVWVASRYVPAPVLRWDRESGWRHYDWPLPPNAESMRESLETWNDPLCLEHANFSSGGL